MVQSPDAMSKVLCESEKSAHMEPVDMVFWSFCAVAKKIFRQKWAWPIWGGAAIIPACMDIRFLNV